MKCNADLREWARMYEKGAVFTAFDTETTGLYCASDRIVEIGAVKFDKNGIVNTYEALIHPQIEIPKQAVDVHGISNEMVLSCPAFKEVALDFLRFTAGTHLVAHNASFDIGFVNAELKRAGYPTLKAPQLPAADTLQLAQNAFPSLSKYNLQFLANTFGIALNRAHRASDDALACKDVFVRCITQYTQAHPEAIRGELSQGQADFLF